MAVQQQEQTVSTHTAAGGAVFGFAYRVLHANDLIVEIDGIEQTEGVDYTIAGVDDEQGGSVTFITAPATGATVKIYRQTRLERLTDYQTAGDFLAPVVNRDFDRVMMALQDSAVRVRNSLRGAPGEVLDELPSMAARANRLLAFDAEGQPVGLVGATADSATALDLALRNALAPSAGAGQIAFGAALAYTAGTVGAALRALFTKAAEVVSVHDFGAVGDGVTDDTVAIQAAIAYAQTRTNSGVYGSYSPANGPGRIYFPQGAYKVTAALVVGYKVSFEGEGLPEYTYGSRLFQATDNTDLIRYDPATGWGSLSIERMVLHSTGTGTGHLVNVTRSAAPYVNSQRYKDCVFAQPQAKALMLTGDDIEISSCLFDVSQKSGDFIQLGGAGGQACSHVRVINNNFFNPTNSCVKLVNVSGLTFSGNLLSQPNITTKTPVVLDATSSMVLCENVTVSDNTFRGARTLFQGAGVNNVTITGNTATESGIGAGETLPLFKWTGANIGVEVSGNIFRGNYDATPFWHDSSAVTVTGVMGSNQFINDGGSGNAFLTTKFNGRLLPNLFLGFVSNHITQKAFTTSAAVNPGLIAANSTYITTRTVIGAALGDQVHFGSMSGGWIAPRGIDTHAFVSDVDTVEFEYRNGTGSGITPIAHDIWYEVTR